MSNSKYVMINGLAFNEKEDMILLQNYAKEGWILEGIVGGIFYKFRKDKPQDIIYSLDYQNEVDEEYLEIFKSAGWDLVVSYKKNIQIFSAPLGTKPIYTDNSTEAEKYLGIMSFTGKNSIYSLVAAIALIALLLLSLACMKPLFLIFEGLLIIDLLILFINFIIHSSYKYRVSNLKKGINIKEKKNSYKLYTVIGIMFIAIGLGGFKSRNIFDIFFVIVGIGNLIYSYSCYKDFNKNISE